MEYLVAGQGSQISFNLTLSHPHLLAYKWHLHEGISSLIFIHAYSSCHQKRSYHVQHKHRCVCQALKLLTRWCSFSDHWIIQSVPSFMQLCTKMYHKFTYRYTNFTTLIIHNTEILLPCLLIWQLVHCNIMSESCSPKNKDLKYKLKESIILKRLIKSEFFKKIYFPINSQENDFVGKRRFPWPLK